MSTRAFLDEEDLDDFANVPLKLHSLMEFLDPAVASLDGNTERQHTSSADSESEEDGRGCDTPNSLRLTPFISANAGVQPRHCFCLDKARCMCSLFALPPLLPRVPATPAAAMVATDEGGQLTSSLLSDVTAPTRTATPAISTADGVYYVPLQLGDVHLTKPKSATAAPAATRTRTSTTCCRC